MSTERAPARSAAEWDRLVDEWLASEEKQGKFAEAHGINPKTFQGRVCQSRKRRGLSRKSKGKEVPCRFVEVTPRSSASDTAQGRVECRITMTSAKVEFTSTPDAGWIAEILSKLDDGRR